jgi:GNAT superfamily N-acetyltransferase
VPTDTRAAVPRQAIVTAMDTPTPTRPLPAASAEVPCESGDVNVRRIRATDAPAIDHFYAALSAESRRTRFFAVGAGLSHRQSVSFCTPDHDHREGFVAVASGAPPDVERIVGHLCLEPAGTGVAEVAIAVEDGSQHQGIGRRLMEAGIEWARAEGFAWLTATTFAGNAPIHRLLAGLGLPAHAQPGTDSGTEDIVVDLRDPVVEG